ncbi:MAG: hypothetical protein INR71_05790 [Terriglobus roseus]|nr:hypothetical protein [Terriglobus roseus]
MQPNPLKQTCTRCGSIAWERLDRRGFFQRQILPFFNRYPWRCALCNKERYLPLRHDPDLIFRKMHRGD